MTLYGREFKDIVESPGLHTKERLPMGASHGTATVVDPLALVERTASDNSLVKRGPLVNFVVVIGTNILAGIDLSADEDDHPPGQEMLNARFS